MSNNDVAISVRGVSKTYSIAHNEERHTRLAEKLMARLRNPLHRPQMESFDALKDVSFDVKKGDVVGIIGRNGAGKSTLLKILSRITEPTKGEIQLYGRVGSLLEVGTGFHPELTGRENIFLNGAILGMRKVEIRNHFDAIVEFSEIEKFLDTPVKRYSSGMYVRLAFAVAAHLNPEILIVDEVLAVGDAEFQKKCLGKMQDVSKQEGRTVLFVSHNMSAVTALCRSGIVLNQGTPIYCGGVQGAVESYLTNCFRSDVMEGDGKVDLSNHVNDYGPNAILQSLEVRNHLQEPTFTVFMGQPFSLNIQVKGVPENTQVAMMIRSPLDQRLVNFNTGMKKAVAPEGRSEREIFSLSVHAMRLLPGEYYLDLSVAHKQTGRIDYVDRAAVLRVEQADLWGTGYAPGNGDGICYFDGDWQILPDPTHSTKRLDP